MKKVLSVLLVTCLFFMGACGDIPSISVTTLPSTEPSPLPSPSHTAAMQATASPPSRTSNAQATASPPSKTAAVQATATPPSPTASVQATTAPPSWTSNEWATASPATPPEEMILYDRGFLSEAEDCRSVADGYEYYFDTGMPFIEKDRENKEPLSADYRIMKKQTGSKQRGVFIGLYGHKFETKNDCLYIESGHFFADGWERWTTRAVSLKDGRVSAGLDDVDLYFPPSGTTVYYVNATGGNTIYYCKPDLTDIKELTIELPDWDNISETIKTLGYEMSADDFNQCLFITKVENGWIYFYDSLCMSWNECAYDGDYRISLDGTKIEKIGKGEFIPLSDYEDTCDA